MSESESPILRVRDLAMRGSRGTVFGPLDWDLYPGQRGVIVGQQGSGRSALLLALGGRLKGARGSVEVDGFDGVIHPRKLRALTSVAQIADLVTLESSLRVGETRDERALSEGLSVREGRERFSMLQAQVGHVFDIDEVTGHLPAVYRTLLAALLGCLRPSAYVLMDDIDASLTDEQLRWMHHKLDLLAGAGNTFIVSTLDSAAIPGNANTLILADPVPPAPPAPPLTPTSAASPSTAGSPASAASPASASSPASPVTPTDHEDA